MICAYPDLNIQTLHAIHMKRFWITRLEPDMLAREALRLNFAWASMVLEAVFTE